MSLACPLCAGSNASVVEAIQTADLIRLYRRSLGVDTAEEFKGAEQVAFCRCSNCDLGFFHPATPGSEKFYAALQNYDWYYLEDKSEYRLAARLIRPTDDVLDIGCGRGAYSAKLGAKSYTGLEMNRKAQEEAERNGIRVLAESAEEHAKENRERYDAVCSFQTLEHIADPRSFIMAGLACLKPGGLLIFSVPAEDSFVSKVRNHLLNLPPHHVTWWTDRCLRNVADLFKLQIVAIEHERLDPIHRQYYAASVASNVLCKTFGYPERLMDVSLGYRILNALGGLTGRMLAWKLSFAKELPVGQSVTAVYRKPEPTRVSRGEN